MQFWSRVAGLSQLVQSNLYQPHIVFRWWQLPTLWPPIQIRVEVRHGSVVKLSKNFFVLLSIKTE